MTTRERVIQAVLDLPEEELEGVYEIIVTRAGKKKSLEHTLEALAQIRASQDTPTDAAALIREARDELDQRVESHL